MSVSCVGLGARAKTISYRVVVIVDWIAYFHQFPLLTVLVLDGRQAAPS